MLALARKKGESVVIGDDIEVVVLGIVGEQVRLGIVAPKRIPVHRKEIFEQIQAENVQARDAASVSAMRDLTNPKAGNDRDN